jgi:SAM-dependent methyltransferase
MSWRDFWNNDHPIYVNDRHRTLHYEAIAQDIVALIPTPAAHVLDHGCGEALAADRVAGACAALVLFDTAPNVQARLRQRFAAVANIRVLDEADLERLPKASLDVVVCNSVLQYLDMAQFEALLAVWHGLLKPGGLLVLADVIPPDVAATTDALALMRFARAGGFVFAALRGLAATYFSNYRKLRAEVGLTTYLEAEMLELLTEHGFDGARAAHNIGHNQARMTFTAERLPG